MSKIKDGGPAFPSVLYGHERAENWSTDGMSLRDWLAGQAMTKLVELAVDDRHFANNEHGAEACAVIAEASYKMADAMLAERAKGGAS